jgi:hypothetical protein
VGGYGLDDQRRNTECEGDKQARQISQQHDFRL